MPCKPSQRGDTIRDCIDMSALSDQSFELKSEAIIIVTVIDSNSSNIEKNHFTRTMEIQGKV